VLVLKNSDTPSGVRDTGTELQAQRRITLAGTSFLLPGNPAWQPLSGDHALEFGEFAEWSSLLLNPRPNSREADTFAFVVFLQDIISSESIPTLIEGRASPEDMERIGYS